MKLLNVMAFFRFLKLRAFVEQISINANLKISDKHLKQNIEYIYHILEA